MNRAAATSLEGDFGRVAIEVKWIGIVINNDTVPRQYDDRLIGVPFSWL